MPNDYLQLQVPMTIDVDGAPNAYGPDDKRALDYEANAHEDADKHKPIVGYLTKGDDGKTPIVQKAGDPFPGFYISTTAYSDPKNSTPTDPRRYVNAAEINYVVIAKKAAQKGVKQGDFVVVHSLKTKKTVYGIVGDSGHSSGAEGSLALLQRLGYPFHGGKTGSVDNPEIVVRYFPGSNPKRHFFFKQADLDAEAAGLSLDKDFTTFAATPILGAAGTFSAMAAGPGPDLTAAAGDPAGFVCSGGWRVTGYYTAAEGEFGGPTRSIVVPGMGTVSFPDRFLDRVRLEGWGETRFGWFLGFSEGHWQRHAFPLNARGGPLRIGSLAVDRGVIPLGTRVRIPSLPAPWDNQGFVADDTGGAIHGQHVDVYCGSGASAKAETERITTDGSNGRVCVARSLEPVAAGEAEITDAEPMTFAATRAFAGTLGGPPAAPTVSASAYARALVAVAQGEYTHYHTVHEGDTPLRGRIRQYWEELGFDFEGVGVAWSAVFVSWCVQTAGATAAEFKFAAAHARFARWAIANAEDNVGLFRAWPTERYAPRLGDIIQNNRGGGSFSYTYARSHSSYESHSAIVVELGEDADGRYAMTVGGNEDDSVRQHLVRLGAGGLVQPRSHNPYICVIQNLK